MQQWKCDLDFFDTGDLSRTNGAGSVKSENTDVSNFNDYLQPKAGLSAYRDLSLHEAVAVDEFDDLPHGEPAAADTFLDLPLADLLKQSKTLIQARRKTMAKGTFDIARQISALSRRLTKSQMRVYLSECGIDRRDLGAYLKLADLPEGQQVSLQKVGSSFAVMKALTAAPEVVRTNAVAQLERGRPIYVRDVAEMKRDHVARTTDPRVEQERRRQKALRAATNNAEVDRRTVAQDRVIAPASPYILQAGAVIPAALITGIRSDLPGQITAQVTQPVYDSPTEALLLIPQGSRLIGE